MSKLYVNYLKFSENTEKEDKVFWEMYTNYPVNKIWQ